MQIKKKKPSNIWKYLKRTYDIQHANTYLHHDILFSISTFLGNIQNHFLCNVIFKKDLSFMGSWFLIYFWTTVFFLYWHISVYLYTFIENWIFLLLMNVLWSVFLREYLMCFPSSSTEGSFCRLTNIVGRMSQNLWQVGCLLNPSIKYVEWDLFSCYWPYIISHGWID